MGRTWAESRSEVDYWRRAAEHHDIPFHVERQGYSQSSWVLYFGEDAVKKGGA